MTPEQQQAVNTSNLVTLEFESLLHDKAVWQGVTWLETVAEVQSGICPAREDALATLAREMVGHLPPGTRGLFAMRELKKERGNCVQITREYTFLPLREQKEPVL